MDDISQTLERQFILRRFNKDFLEMEISSGSAVKRIIGMGERVDKETGKLEKVVNLYPSIFNKVVRTFEVFPFIPKYFGLTVKEAMELPFDEWQVISESAQRLAEHQPPDTETKLFELLKGIVSGRGEGD